MEAVAGYGWVRPHEQEKLNDIQMAAFLGSFHRGLAKALPGGGPK